MSLHSFVSQAGWLQSKSGVGCVEVCNRFGNAKNLRYSKIEDKGAIAPL